MKILVSTLLISLASFSLWGAEVVSVRGTEVYVRPADDERLIINQEIEVGSGDQKAVVKVINSTGVLYKCELMSGIVNIGDLLQLTPENRVKMYWEDVGFK